MRNIKILLAGLLVLSPMAVNAGIISYEWRATFSASEEDVLGIDGESVFLRLLFDTTDQWMSFGGGSLLVVEGTVDTVTITGGNTVAVKNNSVALSWLPGPNGSELLESTTSGSFMDLVINGIETVTFKGDPDPSRLVPAVGDFLDIGHISLSSPIDLFRVNPLYGVLESSLEVNEITEPSTLALLGAGLIGMGFARRRKKA